MLLDGAQKNIKLADFGICTIMEVGSSPLYEVFILFCPEKGYSTYSRTPVTRTLKGNEKQFELSGYVSVKFGLRERKFSSS